MCVWLACVCGCVCVCARLPCTHFFLIFLWSNIGSIVVLSISFWCLDWPKVHVIHFSFVSSDESRKKKTLKAQQIKWALQMNFEWISVNLIFFFFFFLSNLLRKTLFYSHINFMLQNPPIKCFSHCFNTAHRTN